MRRKDQQGCVSGVKEEATVVVVVAWGKHEAVGHHFQRREAASQLASKARPPSLSRASHNQMGEWLNGVLIWNLY